MSDNVKPLLQSVKVTQVSNAVAAGTSDINSSEVDMQGFDSVAFLVGFGTITATAVTSIQIEHSDTSGSGFAVVAGTGLAVADADSNKTFAVELVRPTKRYVRCTVDRGIANAVLNNITALQGNARSLPIVNTPAAQFEINYSAASGAA